MNSSGTADASSADRKQNSVLSRANIAFAVTFLAGGLAIGYLLGRRSASLPRVAGRCNMHVQMSKDKIVDTVELEDIGSKKVFCRCWKSKKFPYCDGTHTAHNKECGDNVGPLIIQAKAKTIA